MLLFPPAPHRFQSVKSARVRQSAQQKQERLFELPELMVQAAREQEWFGSRGFDGSQDARVATYGLVARLMHMYHAYVIFTWLPSAIRGICDEISKLQERDRNLGLPRAHDISAICPSDFVKQIQRIVEELLNETTLADI